MPGPRPRIGPAIRPEQGGRAATRRRWRAEVWGFAVAFAVPEEGLGFRGWGLGMNGPNPQHPAPNPLAEANPGPTPYISSPGSGRATSTAVAARRRIPRTSSRTLLLRNRVSPTGWLREGCTTRQL